MGGYFEGLMNSQMTMEFFLPDGVNGGAATLAIVAMLSMLFQQPYAAGNDQSVVRSETLLRSTTSWDGKRYKSYPPGQPELSRMVKKLEWIDMAQLAVVSSILFKSLSQKLA